MQKYICLAATILIVAIIAFGCSSGSSPTAPVLRDNLAPRDSSGIGQTGLVGLWQVAIDLNSQTIEAVPARTSDLMLNVLCFMEPPALDKMTIDFDTLIIDGENSTVDVDVIFTHPLVTPDNAFQGFDVRGIVFGPEMLNPDGYTAVMNPADFETVPFGYLDGLLGASHSYANYDADYWPYKYFCDDLDSTMEVWDFYYNHSGIAAHRGKFSEGTTHTRHYTLSWLGFEAPLDFLVFNYAVYANFEWGVGEPPFETDDYPTTANSAEAFCMSYDIVNNNLNFYEGSGWGEISMDIRIWDWQGLESTEVTIESIETGVIPPVMVDFFGPGSDPFDGVFSFVDAPGTPTGLDDIDILVTATDTDTTYGEAWFFGLLPTDHPYYDLPVENYWIITVSVGEESPCATSEPVDIEAAPYNGTWLDDLSWDTACASEVSTGTTEHYWVHDESTTSWNTGGVIDNDMNTTIFGPQILIPSTGAMEFIWHFDLAGDNNMDRIITGYQLNGGPSMGLGSTASNVTDTYISQKLAGLTVGDEVTWTFTFASDDTDNDYTGAILWDVESIVFDPGPLPAISDGGAPDPDNAICEDPGATRISYWYSASIGGNLYLYYYWAYPDFRYGAQPGLYTWTIGNSGYMHPYYTPPYVRVGQDYHRECDNATSTDRFIPFGDWTITAQAQSQYGSSFPEWGSDPAGDVYYMIKDDGTATERLIIEYCDVGQIGEADTCRYRVIMNGDQNTNKYDMRIEWIDVGSHVTEDNDDHTAAWMVWNAIFIPIQCDYTAWANNTTVDIDQPDVY